MLLIRLKFPLYFVKQSNCMRKKNIFSSTGQRPVELMRYPFFRRQSVRPSVRKQYLAPLSPQLLNTEETYLWSHFVGPVI